MEAIFKNSYFKEPPPESSISVTLNPIGRRCEQLLSVFFILFLLDGG